MVFDLNICAGFRFNQKNEGPDAGLQLIWARVTTKLQQFANRTWLSITVCHFPPGTSKRNKIEHRLFSHIATNWRGKPLVSLAAIVSLIGSTTTASCLRVRSEIDRRRYPKGIVVTPEQIAKVNVKPYTFHGDWNYTIRPNRRR